MTESSVQDFLDEMDRSLEHLDLIQQSLNTTLKAVEQDLRRVGRLRRRLETQKQDFLNSQRKHALR